MSGDDQRSDLDPKLRTMVEHLQTISNNRPSRTLADGRSAKSKETMRRIIAAAHNVFVIDGYAGLSLRKVADEAGIAVGNLTYHFPNKNDLLKATLRERLAEYAEQHLGEFTADRDSPREILLNIVTFYARNARQSYRFFYQMWGYAGSCDEARDFVRSLYTPIGRFIFYLVRAANPDLDYAAVRRVVLQIFSMEEGYKLFIGLGPEDDLALKAAERDIRELTEQIVFQHR